MYELLIRTETLFLGLNTAELLTVGIPALLIGLVLWLGGTRYSSAIIGLLGAVVGSAVGLMIGPSFGLHPIWSMLIGAVVLAAVSILLKKILILVLAVLVISAVSGAGYIAVVSTGSPRRPGRRWKPESSAACRSSRSARWSPPPGSTI
jgi:hypothetical protein